MEKTFVATPTDYKGVRFRSKSEAMFARYLDWIAQAIPLSWVYEPEYLRVDEWVPDFLVCEVHKHERHIYTVAKVIEYKPSRPSDAYIERLHERYKELARSPQAIQIPESTVTKTLLLWGSPYSDESDIIEFEDDDFTTRATAWLSHNAKNVMLSHRFDLERSV